MGDRVRGRTSRPMPNGLCDPVAGLHATAALLLAIEHRRRTGEGMHVEVTMVGGALNITAEQVIEFQAYDHLMEPRGIGGLEHRRTSTSQRIATPLAAWTAGWRSRSRITNSGMGCATRLVTPTGWKIPVGSARGPSSSPRSARLPFGRLV